MKYFTSLLLMVFSLVSISAQTVFISGTQHSSIQAAINAASDGDVIDITGVHTLTTALAIPDKSFTLRGTDPATDIIQASDTAYSGTDRVISLYQPASQSVTLNIENLGIKNGNSNSLGIKRGGAIYIDQNFNGLVSISNCVIQGSRGSEGGAIASLGCDVTITDTTIKDNTATSGGGLIATVNASNPDMEINISRSLISGNSANNGGGMYINGNNGNNAIEVNIDNATITGNSATSGTNGAGGGAIWAKAANSASNIDLKLIHVTIDNNSHSSAAKNGLAFAGGGTAWTNVEIYNSIVVNADDMTQKAINWVKAKPINIINSIIGGSNAAGTAVDGAKANDFLDDSTKNNQKGKTATQAGLSGGLNSNGVIEITEGSAADNHCSVSIPPSTVTIPTQDQRGFTREGTSDAGAFEFGVIHYTTNTTISSDETFRSIEVESGATLTVDPSGSMDVSGTLTNNGSIVMQSSSTTSAALKASSITGTGTYSYAKHTASTSTNDLISAPFTGQSFSDLMANNSNTIYSNPSDNTQYLFGSYDNNSGAYLAYNLNTDGTLLMNPAQGFRAGNINSESTITFEGNFQTSDQTIAINVGSDPTYGKWNLVGNPFPSYLNLSDFIADNSSILESTNVAVYAYDGDDTNGSVWTIYSSNNSSGITIAPGQGFFVASGSAGGNLQFNVDTQSVNGGDDFLQRQVMTPDTHFQLNLEHPNQVATTTFYFNPHTTLGLDPGYDVGTFANQTSIFGLFSRLADASHESVQFAVQAISNDLTETVSVPLGVVVNPGVDYEIRLNDSSILESVQVYLKDYHTGALVLLNNGSYQFNTNTPLNGSGRFELRFSNGSLGNDQPTIAEHFKAIHQFDTVLITGDFEFNDKIRIYDMLGRLTLSYTVNGNEDQIRLPKAQMARGVYLAQLNRQGEIQTIKFIIN